MRLWLREIAFGIYYIVFIKQNVKCEEERFYFSMGFPTVLPHSAHEPS
jgi:hypothetical protein